MKIVQIMPTVSFGDAVSNDAVAIRRLIAEKGFETGIFAENIDPRFHEAGAAYVRDMPPLDPDDILIYHGSTGTALNFMLPRMGGRPMMIYHNITPPEFFRGYSSVGVQLTESGYRGIRYLADAFSLCVADSDYNRHELRSMGYECPIDVCPIMIPFGDYDREPDQQVLQKYQGDGRICCLSAVSRRTNGSRMSSGRLTPTGGPAIRRAGCFSSAVRREWRSMRRN